MQKLKGTQKKRAKKKKKKSKQTSKQNTLKRKTRLFVQSIEVRRRKLIICNFIYKLLFVQ